MDKYRWLSKTLKITLLVSWLPLVSQAQIWPAMPVPLHLAEPAVIAAQKAFPNDQQSRYEFIDAYGIAFLEYWRIGPDRFNSKNRMTTFSHAAAQQGYDAGKAATASDLILLVTPQDFGYSIVELEGKYHGSFEISEFVTKDNQRYHFNPGLLAMPENKKQMRIQGWLSPKGGRRYGHMIGWEREVIAIKLLQ